MELAHQLIPLTGIARACRSVGVACALLTLSARQIVLDEAF